MPFTDARQIPDATELTPDLAIVGGGPAGITLALSLANTPIKMLLLESGGMEFDAATQALYAGEETGVHYIALDATRLRYLGGGTNHWGGWSRPLDKIDFERREWLPFSGWPFPREEIEPYFSRAQQLIEAGPFLYDKLADGELPGPLLPMGKGGLYNSFFQFSQWRGSPEHLPTAFGHRYADQLKRIPNLQLVLHANVTGLRLAQDVRWLDHLDVATLSGRKFTVKPRHTVLACGGIENARILLASNETMIAGVGNQNDQVGRFFADHAIPRDTATLVVFGGEIAGYYKAAKDAQGAHFRATISPTETFRRDRQLLGALITVEQHVELDTLGRATVETASAALGVDASNAHAYSLGVGLELAPDPDRRLTLGNSRDALGMPRLKLNMTVADDDLTRYREVLNEFGRQLLAAKTGMLRIDRHSRAEWLSVMDWGNHHMGTTRMHEYPRQGVVDANSQVHGMANLFVAGSSVFPTYSASNPTLNLVALTVRLADHLRGVFR
ncbi:MAG TPA: GMC family oxidoreductase [Rhizomicrobium sp.]|nr:GMC family oxidoreductase [Rhizomicrobium sp.]